MLDAIAVHIELVRGDRRLGEAVPDAVVDPELPDDSLRGGRQVSGLDMELLAVIFADKTEVQCEIYRTVEYN